jgi:hypothetical protein
MNLKVVLIRFMLLAALAAPVLYGAIQVYDKYQELEFARERLNKIRTEAGKMVVEAGQARRSSNALAKGAIDAWGQGDGKQRILAAFGETKLAVESVSTGSAGASGEEGGQTIPFSQVIVRGSGSITAVKEVLWNVGDLGPGIRLSSLQGDFDPGKETTNWLFSFLLVNSVELPSKTQSGIGTP